MERNPFETGPQPNVAGRVLAAALVLGGGYVTVEAMASRADAKPTPIVALWHGNGEVSTGCDDVVTVKVSYPEEGWSQYTALASPGFGSQTDEIAPGETATFTAHVGDTVNPTADFDTDGDGKFKDAGGSEHWQLWANGKKMVHPKDCPEETTTTESTTTTVAPTTTTTAPAVTTTTEKPAETSTTIKTTTTTAPAVTTTTEKPAETTTTTVKPAETTTTTVAPSPTTTVVPHNAPTE